MSLPFGFVFARLGGPVLVTSPLYRAVVGGFGSLALWPMVALDGAMTGWVLAGVLWAHVGLGLWVLGRLIGRDLADGPWRPGAALLAQAAVIAVAGGSVLVGELLLGEGQASGWGRWLFGAVATGSLTVLPAWVLACVAAPRRPQ